MDDPGYDIICCEGNQAAGHYLVPPKPRLFIGPAVLCLHALEGPHSSHDIGLVNRATCLSNLAFVTHSPPSIASGLVLPSSQSASFAFPLRARTHIMPPEP